MMRIFKAAGVVVLVSAWAGAAPGQTTPATQPAATRPAEDKVAVTVNGHDIMTSEVEEVLRASVPEQALNDPQAAQMLDAQRERIREMLIDEYLLAQEVEKEHVKVSDEDLARMVEANLEAYLVMNGLTRERLDEQLRETRNISLEQAVKDVASNDQFRQSRTSIKLIEAQSPDKLEVTDEEVKEFYDKNRERRFSTPAQVRASHILVKTQGKSEEEKSALRKKAEELLAEARKPGADFAALARENSDCPSRERGGDLGFFPRTGPGSMVEPFADAAFSLGIGEISDVVETGFGYHIIKVTDKKDAKTVTLEQAAPAIRYSLRERKARDATREYTQKLREDATIKYPPGKEPTTHPAMGSSPRPITTRPSGQPGARPTIRRVPSGR
jgi:peptidyl-prolyl cis-trans isomerase C